MAIKKKGTPQQIRIVKDSDLDACNCNYNHLCSSRHATGCPANKSKQKKSK